MKKKLSEYIDIAKNINSARPLLPIEEMRNLKSESAINHKNINFRNFTKGFIMKTIISIILISSVVLFTYWNSDEKNTGDSIQNQISANSLLSNSVSDSENNNNEDNDFQFKGLPLLKLTDEELEKLCIYKIEDGYKILVETKISGTRKELSEFSKLGYDTSSSENIMRFYTFISGKDIYDKNIENGNWHKTKSAGFFNFAYTAFNADFHVNYSSSNGLTPIMKSVGNLFDEKYLYLKQLTKIDNLEFGKLDFLPINQDSFPSLRLVIPLYLNAGNFKNTILWYVPTNEFINRIPARYQKIVKEYYKPVEYYVAPESPKFPDEIEMIKEKYLNKIKESLTNFPTLDLTWEELKQLGISKITDKSHKIINDDEYLKYQTKTVFEIQPFMKAKLSEYGIDTNLLKILVKSHIYVSSTHIGGSSEESKKIDWSPDLSDFSNSDPVSVTVVTDEFIDGDWNKYRGNSTYTQIPDYLKNKFDDDIAELLSESHTSSLNKTDYKNSKEWLTVTSLLIPVHVTLGNKKEIEGNRYSDIIFWFFPNEEFLNKLPRKYATSIRKELKLISDLKTGRISQEEACKGMESDESYFNICGVNSRILENLTIAPNPWTKGDLKIEFKLKENRKLNISLHDMNGNIVFTYCNEKNYQSGEININIPKNNLSNGMYYFVVCTNREEILFEKVIVE